MPWIGSVVPIPGLLTGFQDTIIKVRDFDQANTLTNITLHVADAPSGGDLTFKLHDQADGLGTSATAVILDGTTYISQDVTLTTGAGLWQEIIGNSQGAMSLSGEYTMSSASGITDYFTTLALVKADANISGTDADRDAVITSMMQGVTRQMQDWMGRDIVQGTTTAEQIDGWYDDTIYTKHWPITNITSLSEDGTALVEDTDFESLEGDQEVGQIVRISGGDPIHWTHGRRNIVITYDHGYTAVPDSLVRACTAMVVVAFNETNRSVKSWRGLNTKGVDPASAITYDKDLWTREVIPAMIPFHRRVP
jgi:hypothetical protein